MSSSPANSCLLFLSPTQVVPHSFQLMTLTTIWYLFLWPYAWDYRHPTTITTLRSVFLASLWEVPSRRWEVVFYLVQFTSPYPLSLALEMFPEEQDFLWRYQRTLICWTCCDANRRPLSLADNPDFGLFGPLWWYSGISHFLLLFLILVISQLRWSPVIIGCQVYP